MNKQKIERAAIEHCATETGINKIPYKHGFRDGADWRIDSTWHKPQEKPRMNEFVLAEDETKGNYSVYKLTGQNWEQIAEVFNIIRWCYIEDLLPDDAE